MTISKNIQLELPLFARYKVTHFIDCGAWIDPNPTIEYFEEWYEMEDYANEETQRRIDYTVEHSPFTVSDEEYKEIEDYENSMYKIEEITNNGLKLIKGWVNSNIQSFT